jgi:hypothetical protein
MRKKLNTQQLLMSNYEIRNDQDLKLWFMIKSIDKKLDSLGKIGSKNFDWLRWEDLTDESARLYSQLSIMEEITKSLQSKYNQ